MMNKYFFALVMSLIISLFLTGTILAQPQIHPTKLRSIDNDQLQSREELLSQNNRNDEQRVRIRPEIFDAMKFPDSSLYQDILRNEPSVLSQQSGGSWIALGPEGGPIQTILMSRTDHDTLYAKSYNYFYEKNAYLTKIFKSTDGSTSWNLVGSIPTYITAITIDPDNSSVLYATNGRYMYNSVDGGATWNQYLMCSRSEPYVTDIFVSSKNNNIIYAGGGLYANKLGMAVFKSIDRGLNWTTYEIPSSGDNEYTYCFSINPANPNMLYIGGYRSTTSGLSGVLYKSTKGGTNWTEISNGIVDKVYALAINPISPNIIYVGTEYGIYRSVDSGLKWDKDNKGIPSCELAIDPKNSNIIYSGWEGCIYKSIDGGSEWTTHGDGLVGKCNTLLVDHTTTNKIYFGSPDGVFKSDNHGVNWFAANSGLITASITAMAISPSDPNTLYIEFDNNALFKTTTSGEKWERLPEFLSCGFIGAIVVDPISPKVAYALEGSG